MLEAAGHRVKRVVLQHLSPAFEDGTADQQSTTSFTRNSFDGKYAVVMGGTVSGIPRARTGVVFSDGTLNLGWSLITTSPVQSTCSIGAYSVAANGRVSATLALVSSNMIFYLISPSAAYVIQVDNRNQMVGGAVYQNHVPTPFIPGTF